MMLYLDVADALSRHGRERPQSAANNDCDERHSDAADPDPVTTNDMLRLLFKNCICMYISSCFLTDGSKTSEIYVLEISVLYIQFIIFFARYHTEHFFSGFILEPTGHE